MIDTIIFDFGDIFINLEKEAQIEAFKKLGLNEPNEELIAMNDLFEKGKVSEIQFIESFHKFIPNASLNDIRDAWNTIIGEFPLYRLEFLQLLSHKYRLFLLTNTDEIHINRFENNVGVSFFSDFYQCFEKVYYSYEMGMRKPDAAIYSYIVNKHDLSPKRTLFVDDKKTNTDAAASIGLHVWNLEVGKEDVVDLFDQKHLPL
ncbi:HAD family hydrolase [Flavobacterium aquatile]|uniref:Haloacid dehalogenase n=1 Tax=Flavobacterium aquatile LMG 4008 = ATCC 11947 TaxID=1453498 RepID=A0A095SY14_9FLAO|nr:HAD family phosphatase [Flavobacterium aquatile]KGD69566.1 haloacid dehalogenase [Flavobacterium aquatile LMG 4008 = ATCC 11947]OXA67301.1 haloacid dehalogenase [Flavobacterium aquatile] [Flavobacterium aquatile LMG 4008 = ATCC 11947]GEC77961.1 haloacid dehalogenase [Flavobacterium aquatile]